MSRSTQEQDSASSHGRAEGLSKRWSARRNAEVVLRLLRGDDIGEVGLATVLSSGFLEGCQLLSDLRKIVCLAQFDRGKIAIYTDHMFAKGHGELSAFREKGRWIAGQPDQPLKTLGKFAGVVIQNGPIESLPVDVGVARMEARVCEDAVFENFHFEAYLTRKARRDALIEPKTLLKRHKSQAKQEVTGIAGIQPYAEGPVTTPGVTGIATLKLEKPVG